MIGTLLQAGPYVFLAASACGFAWLMGYIVGGQHMREKMVDKTSAIRKEIRH